MIHTCMITLSTWWEKWWFGLVRMWKWALRIPKILFLSPSVCPPGMHHTSADLESMGGGWSSQTSNTEGRCHRQDSTLACTYVHSPWSSYLVFLPWVHQWTTMISSTWNDTPKEIFRALSSFSLFWYIDQWTQQLCHRQAWREHMCIFGGNRNRCC